ncbi:MAG: hypothetical protein QM652_00085 [Legionella sp.]|uniref:hypothetical protein n=1 Tax=Legionella sp. TaxID=459 RepID=UPI0039E2806D
MDDRKNKRQPSQFFYLYSLYLAIDSGKLPFAFIRYYFDIVLNNPALVSQEMQKWMFNPLGSTIVVISVFSSVSIALLSLNRKQEEQNANKQILISLWFYTRDAIKNLRNALRGVSSTFTLFYLLDIDDLRYLIIPTALFIGIISALNRMGTRYRMSKYHEQVQANEDFLKDIQELKHYSSEQFVKLNHKIHRYSSTQQLFSFSSTLLGALIDGINPYIGTLTIGTLSPSMLPFIATFSLLFFIATLIIKINDELHYQKQFVKTQKSVELALISKEIDYLELTGKYSALRKLHYRQKQLKQDIDALHVEYPVFLAGIKQGLAYYKYIMLSINTITFISPIKIASILPIHRTALGMLSLISGISVKLALSCTNKKANESLHMQNRNLFFAYHNATPSHQYTNKFNPKMDNKQATYCNGCNGL